MVSNAMELRMREALFFGEDAEPVGPVSFALGIGERLDLSFATQREAAVVAMLASAIVKPAEGCVLVDGFDSRIQPAACKRAVGYVPHDPVPLSRPRFRDLIAYRALLWGVDPQLAQSRAAELLVRLEGVHEAFAYPLAAALVTEPQFLILDRPQPAYAQRIADAAGGRATLATHVLA
jgi:ABC-type taurine transport system ATPase subunit